MKEAGTQCESHCATLLPRKRHIKPIKFYETWVFPQVHPSGALANSIAPLHGPHALDMALRMRGPVESEVQGERRMEV